jgi:hypothetical protein
VQQLDRDEVSLLIQAPAEDIYALVADVTRTPEAGTTWRNRPVVTTAVPGCEFAFSRTEPFAGTLLWRYRLEPEDDGTRVTVSYEVTRPITRLGWFIVERIFRPGDVRAGLRAGMRTTLQRLGATAERDSAARNADAVEPVTD